MVGYPYAILHTNSLQHPQMIFFKFKYLMYLKIFTPSFLGFFDRREFIVTQHPTDRTICDFWRMVWEQDTRLVLALSSIDSQECRPFWPSMIGETLFWDTNKRGEQLRLTLLEELDTFAKRSIRLNLELCVSFHAHITMG